MPGVFLIQPGAIYQVDSLGNPVSGSTEQTLLNVSGALDSVRKRLDVPLIATASVSVTNFPSVQSVSLGSGNSVVGFFKLIDSGSANVAQVTAAGRLMVDTGNATALIGLVKAYLVNSGSSNLNYNGSVTPKFFEYKPGANDVELVNITFIAEEPTISFGTTFFGITGLTNGMQLQLKANNVVYELGNFKYTRDMVEFTSPGGFDLIAATPDIARITQNFPSGVTLKKSGSFASPDYIRVLVRDNISSLDFFRASVIGVEK